jgi:hypothetical protein
LAKIFNRDCAAEAVILILLTGFLERERPVLLMTDHPTLAGGFRRGPTNRKCLADHGTAALCAAAM